MLAYFEKTLGYLNTIDMGSADPLDRKAYDLINNEDAYERASQALRRRFVRGAEQVEGMDRGGRITAIRREGDKGKYTYFVQGIDGNWNYPDERIWVVAMYALWQDAKKN